MIGPNVTLTGSADKFLWIYLGVFGVIVLGLIYWLGLSTGKKSTDASGQLKDEIKNNNLSYPLSQYGTWADMLESAMFRPGTDEKAIYQVFRKMNNADDVKQLIISFGSRRQELTFGGSTLPQWLTAELDASEMQELNNILIQRNINYSF